MDQIKYPSINKPILLSFFSLFIAFTGVLTIVIALFSSKQPWGMSKTMTFLYGCVFLIILLIPLILVKKGSFTVKDLDYWLRENGFSTKIYDKLLDERIHGKKDHFFIISEYIGSVWVPSDRELPGVGPTSRFGRMHNDTIKIFFQYQAPNCNIFIQKKGDILKIYKSLIPFLAPVKMTAQEYDKMKNIIEEATKNISYLYCSIYSCHGIVGICMGPVTFKHREFARINTINAIKFTENLRNVLNKNGFEYMEVVNESLSFEKVAKDMDNRLFRSKLYFKENKKSKNYQTGTCS